MIKNETTQTTNNEGSTMTTTTATETSTKYCVWRMYHRELTHPRPIAHSLSREAADEKCRETSTYVDMVEEETYCRQMKPSCHPYCSSR